MEKSAEGCDSLGAGMSTFFNKSRILKELSISLFTVILFVAATNSLYAAEKERGQSGAKFLEFSPSARASAMGEACVAISDLSGIVLNPAGLAFLEDKEIKFVHSALYERSSMNFLTGVLPIQNRYALGIDFLGFDTPREPLYDWVGNKIEGELYYKGTAIGVAGAIKIKDNIAIGTNIKTVSEDICGSKDSAFSSDFGGMIMFPLSSRKLHLGVKLRTGSTRVLLIRLVDHAYLLSCGAYQT